jgi:hypothetical protein
VVDVASVVTHHTSTIQVCIRRPYSRPRPQGTKRVKRSGERSATSKEHGLNESEDLIHRTLLELFKVTTTVANKWEGDGSKLGVFDTFILFAYSFQIYSLVRHLSKSKQ